MFDREREKVVEFINICYLYISIRIGESSEEKKISWMLIYIQRRIVKVWKENVLEKKK